MTQSTSDSANSLSAFADACTRARSRPDAPAAAPAIIAAMSPLHDLLIDDLAETAPVEISQKLKGARTMDDVHDWLGAIAVYRWVKEDRDRSSQFLQTLANSPKNAGLALATTIARSLERPPPSAKARELDRDGVALQAWLATLVLLMRLTCLTLPIHLVSGNPWTTAGFLQSQGDALQGRADWLHTHWAFVIMLGFSSWLILEIAFVSQVIRDARSAFYAGANQIAEHPWQTDSLAYYRDWQSLALLLLVGLFVLRLVYQDFSGIIRSPLQAAAALITLVVIGIGLICGTLITETGHD